jgi:hypothetical protein
VYGVGVLKRFIGFALSACLRSAVGLILYIASRLLWTVEMRGLEYDTGAPRTYLAITHRRDLDSMAPVLPILLHRGWRALARETHFAMRSDSFSPGFLARVVTRPRWLARLMRPLAVGPVLNWLGIQPTQKLHLRPAEEWIRDAIEIAGNARAGDVLSPAFVQELAAAGGWSTARVERLRLSRTLRWRFYPVMVAYRPPSILSEGVRRRAEMSVVALAKRYLAEQAAWLARGGSIYSAPEGGFSPDGALGPITSGFHRLLKLSPSDTRVVPICIFYDFMTVGRRHMFVDLAPAIERAPEMPRAVMDARLRRSWLEAGRFTCTQLASGFLVRASRAAVSTFTTAELVDALVDQATNLAGLGRHVDARLLRRRRAGRLARGYLAFAERHHLVRREGDGVWTALPVDLHVEVEPGEASYSYAPLANAWNELQDMLSVSPSAGLADGMETRASGQ